MEKPFLPDAAVEGKLLELLRAGEPVVLAVVIEAEGSTPQVPGASALFTREGLASGTVGGGPVEDRTQKAAERSLRTGRSALLSFDLAGEASLEAEGICGGRMRILVDGDPGRDREAFEALVRAAKRRRAGVLATILRKAARGARVFPSRRWIGRDPSSAALREAGLYRLRREIAAALAENRPAVAARGEGCAYLEPRRPAPRLVIAGAGHVGRAASRLGAFLGYRVEVIDDRPEFASRERFPEAARLIVGDPAAELGKAALDVETSVVIVTRGHSRDAEALRACIKSRAGYIGMIGSARKVGLLKKRFLDRGWATPAEWSRVHSPIGLPIGSRTVEEIAVSIAAELVAERRKAGK